MARLKKMPPRILATRHETVFNGQIRIEQVVLDGPPVANVSAVDAIMGGWWLRSGGYPVGGDFGSRFA